MGSFGVKVKHFPLTLLVVLTTLTLPCERDVVVIILSVLGHRLGSSVHIDQLLCFCTFIPVA